MLFTIQSHPLKVLFAQHSYWLSEICLPLFLCLVSSLSEEIRTYFALAGLADFLVPPPCQSGTHFESGGKG